MVWGVIYHPEVQKDLDLLGDEHSLWERACSRRRTHIQH